jgi:ABC-2 type transport system permease protein
VKVATIVWANLLRAGRDRNALFFSILLPMILILVLGLTYGGQSSVRIGVADADGGARATALVDELAATPGMTVEIRRYDSPDALRDASAHGLVQAGIAIPGGYSAALDGGRAATVTVFRTATQGSSAVSSAIDGAIASQGAQLRAARFAASDAGLTQAAAEARARQLAASMPGIQLAVETVNGTDQGVSGYLAGARSQLILFMFLTSLTGAVELVTTRQLGIARRVFGTPTGMWTIVGGEAGARIVFALLQGLFIVVASTVLFGVDWGDPFTTGAVVVVFSLVCGGAAMLVGSLAASPSQAGALAPALGMLLGLVGGTMVPAEVFPETMRTISRLTPHAWAMDALGHAGAGGGGVVAIAPQLGVLAAFALLVFGAAVWRFRRVLSSGG